MRNGTKHKMIPLLSPFTTCVLSRLFCQMKRQMCRPWDCSGLFLYPDLTTRGLTGQLIPIPNPIYIDKKKQNLEQELPSLLQSYELWGKQPFVSDFSRLLRHAKEKGRDPTRYSKKTRDPTGKTNFETLYCFKDIPGSVNMRKPTRTGVLAFTSLKITGFRNTEGIGEGPL